MTAEDLNALHENPANWHFIFFYFSPKDPRIVVKRRRGIGGWTLNFARPMALPFLAALIAAVYGCVDFLSRFDISESARWVGIFLLIVMIGFLCTWMSNPRRHIPKDDS